MERPLDAVRPRLLTLPKYLLLAMRPKQWVKNAIVFAALIFSDDRQLGELGPTLRTFAAVVLWCLIASSIYLINDLVDIEKDRRHPKKRMRPLASGNLSPAAAIAATVVMLGGGLPLAFMLSVYFGAIMSFYVVMQLAYSFKLKHVVILDIFIIAAGFVLRAASGAAVINIHLSHWLLLCVGLLSLFLAVAKRRHELVLLENDAGSHRKILDEYSIELLQEMISIVTASTLIAYVMYTIYAPNIPHEPFPLMLLTVPFVIYGIFRYLYLVYKKDEGGSPEELLLKDVPMIINGLLWVVTTIGILYGFGKPAP
ncbi:MAG: decaprenyl-phosphate phosphoribosyltransferase [Herpetosiphonaceae bacterium]|nr:MAG: decaprenyl-phosphate phosphoribosyltransferase [Herpetosiphonaceae bacterium]